MMMMMIRDIWRAPKGFAGDVSWSEMVPEFL